MHTNTFLIPNISCGHCLATIKNELSELDGVVKVEGNPEEKHITVVWKSPVTLEMIKDRLKEINYPST